MKNAPVAIATSATMAMEASASTSAAIGRFQRTTSIRTGVPSQNLNPDILMMESAEDRYRRDTADLLRSAKIRSIFVQ